MANRLQLSASKTEIMWCSSYRRQHQIPMAYLNIGGTSVQPVSTVRDLGVHLNSDLSMRAHITATVRACFTVLRQIRSVQRSLSRSAMLTLIRALVISKVDYCNSVLTGVSGAQLARLQSVLKAAARLVSSATRSDHVISLLHDLHWLKVPERIRFRLCVLAYHCIHGTASTYLAETLHLAATVNTHL